MFCVIKRCALKTSAFTLSSRSTVLPQQSTNAEFCIASLAPLACIRCHLEWNKPWTGSQNRTSQYYGLKMCLLCILFGISWMQAGTCNWLFSSLLLLTLCLMYTEHSRRSIASFIWSITAVCCHIWQHNFTWACWHPRGQHSTPHPCQEGQNLTWEIISASDRQQYWPLMADLSW